MMCHHCEGPVIQPVIWKVTVPYFNTGSSQRLDAVDTFCSKVCKDQHIKDYTEFLIDLDKPMNFCRYFKRAGKTMTGAYVRDGATFAPVDAHWVDNEIQFAEKLPKRRPYLGIANFKQFLIKHAWLKSWYVRRETA